MNIYKVLVAIIKAVARLALAVAYPVRITGMENIPAEGAFMLCPNHISFLDPVYVVLHFKRRIRFMGKKELFKNKFIGNIFREVGAFPVDRGNADLAAVREAIKTLQAGQGLGIFPQGTRSADNEHTQLHTGAALIVQRTGSPVIPMYIDGPYRLFRRTKICIGSPIDLTEFGKKCDSQTIAKVTEAIDNGIWSLKD